MVSRNYIGALALTGLLGCSTHPESRDSDYVAVGLPTEREESLLRDYAPKRHEFQDVSAVNFRGKKVLLTYHTNDGPRSSYPLRPIDLDFVQGVQGCLNGAKAYVLPVGNPNNHYGDINFSFEPRFGVVPDLVVIADKNPNISGIDAKLLGKVYTVSFDGKNYNFEIAGLK